MYHSSLVFHVGKYSLLFGQQSCLCGYKAAFVDAKLESSNVTSVDPVTDSIGLSLLFVRNKLTFNSFSFIVFQQTMSSEQQARDLISQAQKKLNSWSFFGPSNKYEDAAELYEKAGNMFKLAQQCKK